MQASSQAHQQPGSQQHLQQQQQQQQELEEWCSCRLEGTCNSFTMQQVSVEAYVWVRKGIWMSRVTSVCAASLYQKKGMLIVHLACAVLSEQTTNTSSSCKLFKHMSNSGADPTFARGSTSAVHAALHVKASSFLTLQTPLSHGASPLL
jgi:hypothetical protein